MPSMTIMDAAIAFEVLVMLKEKDLLDAPSVEEIAVDGFDFIEFYVGNALQAAYYYERGFGFDLALWA